MVADGARGLAVPLPGGTPRPEVKPAVKNLNFCLFGNAAHENSGCEDLVKQSEAFYHYKPQVNGTKPEMSAQFFSPLFGGITNTPPNVESPQLYCSWSTCADDTSAVAPLQDCTKKRAQINLSYSGNGPDMFGLVSSILEEPNKQEPVTDWNALSRLFPPMWSSDSENSFSGLFPKHILEHKDHTNLVGTLQPYEEDLRESPSTESLKKGLDSFYLTGTWHALSNPCAQPPEKMFRDTAPANKVFKRHGISQQDGLEYRNMHSYEKKQLHTDGGRSRTDFTTFSSQARVKGGADKEYPKTDQAGGVLGGNNPEGPCQYFGQLSNNASAEGIWDLVTQESNLSPERYTDFTAAPDSLQFTFPSLYVCSPTSNKENRFPDGTHAKLQETYPPNARNSINTETTFNAECKVPVYPPKVSCNPLPLKPATQNTNSSYNGYTWLDTKILNTATMSCAAYRKPVSSHLSPPHSSGSSDQSAGQLVCPQRSATSPLRNGEKLQVSSNVQNSSGFSSSSEKQKKPSPIGCSQNPPSVTPEGLYGKIPISVPSSGPPPQYPANENAKYHRFHNKQSQFNAHEWAAHNERRGKNSGIPHPGYAGPNRAQFDALRRKQDQNGGCLADFINPSFLPLFPFVPGYKPTPSFPPFGPHPFPSPANVAFSPLPFPLSELVDLFHCEDFHHLSPFINDLFCAEVSAPCFAFPPPLNTCRPPKNRSGPANELHVHLEECYDQWRALERERKKAEADLARNFPGKRVSSSNNTPFSRLPAKPSRVDRLIVDQWVPIHSAPFAAFSGHHTSKRTL
ncbi:PREDICTED: uncharacterized protein LOC107111952 [Gekko japonicus]|uniref:Uncharacterized protein LOC107111952 n=1 Tax=Gekko japonicus TaxID=146911 RepID=A0ABM1K447_GEKJA|nr:PREDICTED: uncharacterized protein LOC107111952 [Gekko japonicus]